MSLRSWTADVIALRAIVCKVEIALKEITILENQPAGPNEDGSLSQATISYVQELLMNTDDENTIRRRFNLGTYTSTINSLYEEIIRWQIDLDKESYPQHQTGTMPDLDEAHLEAICVTMDRYAIRIKLLLERCMVEARSLSSSRHGIRESCFHCNDSWEYPPMEVQSLSVRPARTLDKVHCTNSYEQAKEASFQNWKRRHIRCQIRAEASLHQVNSDNRLHLSVSSVKVKITARNPLLLFDEVLRPAIQQARECFTKISENYQSRVRILISHWEMMYGRLRLRKTWGDQAIRVLAMLLLSLGRQYAITGLYEQAIERVERSHRYLSGYWPDSDSDCLLTKIELALLYCHSGQDRNARNLLVRLTPIMEEILARNEPLHSCLIERYRMLASETEHKDDGESVFSAIDTEYTGTTLVDSSKETMDILIDHFTASITRDGLTQSLLSNILSHSDISRSTLQNNVRKLLNHLAGDLHTESPDHETRALKQFIARNSPRISNSILKVVDGGTELAGLPSMSLSSKQKTVAFLENHGLSNLESAPGMKAPDTELEGSDDGLDEDAHDAIEEHMVSDDMTKQLSDIMGSMSDRLIRSLAYQNFRLSIHNLAYPTVTSRLSYLMKRWSRRDDPNHEFMSRYRLKELVASLRDFNPETFRINEAPGSFSGSLSFYRRKIERFTETPWDWWPLPPPLDPINEDECRLTWKCTCGETRYTVIPNEFAERLQVYAATSSSPVPPPPARIPQIIQCATSTSLSAGMASSINSAPNTQCTPQASIHLATKLPSSRKFDSMRIILVVKRGDDYKLSQINLQQLDCHGFFSSLRKDYFRLRGFVRGWLSVWRYSHCDFYTCEKFSGGCFTPKKKDSFPIETDNDYDYDKPLDSIPPIQDHEFRVRFYACHKSNPIRHFWHTCRRLGGHSDDVLGLFPKKKTELEEAGDKREKFWGVFARERPSLLWILIYNLLCLTPMLGFFIARAVQLPSDLQNPAVPFTFMLTALSTFWSILLATHDFGRSG